MIGGHARFIGQEVAGVEQADALAHAGVLDDDALVAPELRMAYRILKNAGMLPPEVEAVRDDEPVDHVEGVLGAAVHPDHPAVDDDELRQRLADGTTKLDWIGGIGDVAVGAKRALFHSLENGSVFSLAGELKLPTGDRGD